MSRPDPIQYAERLYAAIRGANFSPISFLAFGNAVKEGIDLRRMPRIAAEPFMRIVGEMLDLEDEAADGEVIDADVEKVGTAEAAGAESLAAPEASAAEQVPAVVVATPGDVATAHSSGQSADRRRDNRR